MNGTILSSGVCILMVCFVVLWITPTNRSQIVYPVPVQKLSAKQKIYLPYTNEYVAVFGNRFENPRGRWKLARKLYKKSMFDKLRSICERAFSRTRTGFIRVDRAQVKLGFLTFREPEFRNMIVDVLICEIENTESVEGSKAQFFLTKGKTNDSVYYLYPLDLERMEFMVLTDRHVTKVVDPEVLNTATKKNNIWARSYYRSNYISKKYKRT